MTLATCREAMAGREEGAAIGVANQRETTVFGLMPSSRLSSAVEARDRCIAARTACVVAALP